MKDYSHAQDFLDGIYDDKIKKTIVYSLIVIVLLNLVPEIGWILGWAYTFYTYNKLCEITTVPISTKRLLVYIGEYIAILGLVIFVLLGALLSLLSAFTVGISSLLCAMIMFLVNYKLYNIFVDALRKEAREHLNQS